MTPAWSVCVVVNPSMTVAVAMTLEVGMLLFCVRTAPGPYSLHCSEAFPLGSMEMTLLSSVGEREERSVFCV